MVNVSDKEATSGADNGKMSHKDEKKALRRAKAIVWSKFSFYIHLVIYVLVNILLASINLMTSPDFLWFIFPVLGWGLGLAIHGIVAFAVSDLIGARSSMLEKELEKQRRR